MSSHDSLPDPDAHPQADVVIFDGECQFCTAQVRRLAAIDRWGKIVGAGGRLAYISLHDPRIHQRYPDLSHEMLMERMYVVDGRQRRHGGADAVRYLTRRLPLLWPAMPILHLPGSAFLWRWLYGEIARRRYQWNVRTGRAGACEGDACAVHLAASKTDPHHGG